MVTREHPAETLEPAIFSGPNSLRVGSEWSVLFRSIAAIFAAAPLIAYLFPSVASLKEVALLIIGAMIYVTFARGRLIGGSIRVHAGQFGHVYEIALECSRALRMNCPSVFVRDDPQVPIVAVGIGEPYSLIISAQWVDHLTPAELRFLIGRELAHIAAGHARITSLLSVNGRENAVISILFGAWLRRIEYTADRAGLLCCASLEGAISAISVSTFHLVGRKIDLAAFAEQQREIDAETSLRIGEWTSSTPYATRRIAALRDFARDPSVARWAARFERARARDDEPVLAATLTVPRRAYANFGRRVGALFIDAIALEAIIPNLPLGVFGDAGAKGGPAFIALGRHFPGLAAFYTSGGVGSFILLAYVILLVGLAGQTLGMMIMDLRVVSDRFERVGIAGAFFRYACFIGSLVCVIGFVRIFGRVQPFEKWSGTRLISGAAFARQRERLANAP
jgi:Zn-dependent protease with chaperone function/uncharacterized RDD family membrane protein YckC